MARLAVLLLGAPLLSAPAAGAQRPACSAEVVAQDLLESRAGPGSGEFEQRLGRWLERDGRAVETLRELAPRVPAESVPLLVREAHEHLGSRVLELRPTWLAEGGAYERAVLVESAGLGPHVLAHGLDRILPPLRERVLHRDPALRRLAVRALGELRDGGAAELLIQALDDEHDDVARSAAWALVRIAGQDLGAEAGAWRRWLAAQHLGAARIPAWLVLLRRPEPSEQELAAAVQALVAVPLERHRLARDLAPLLAHPEPRVVAAVCEALVELGSPAALPALLQALDRPELLARCSAWKALRSLTGLELTMEPRPWREHLLR